MGWGRTLLLGDIGNRLDIADTEREIDNLRREMRGGYDADMSQDAKIEKLIAENGELKLYLAALIRLLKTNGTISREDLRRMVDVLDARDGAADGKYDGKL